ncbi:MAG: hypothetical protein PHQ33_07395 [Bacteroidales bacterium]|nr:hypothetical protein [Bacteroidales bacterium]
MRGIIVDDNGNLQVQNGTLKIGDNMAQVAQHLITAFTGEYKNAPLLGGNAKRMIAGNVDPFWTGNMKRQLKQALVNVESLRVIDNEIELTINN